MDLGWWDRIPRARASEPAALEEAQFTLGPWAHGVLLAHVAYAEAGRLAVEVLARTLSVSAGYAEPLALIRALIDEARATSRQAPATTDPTIETDALRALGAMKRLGRHSAE